MNLAPGTLSMLLKNDCMELLARRLNRSIIENTVSLPYLHFLHASRCGDDSAESTLRELKLTELDEFQV